MIRPYTRTLARQNKPELVFGILSEGIESIPLSALKRKFKVSSLIRFHKADFRQVTSEMKLLTHFNLFDTSHLKGRYYLLVPILVPGYFDMRTEIPPILDFRRALRAKCLGVKNEVAYADINKEEFRHSISAVKTVPLLKKAILRRYKNSMVHKTKKEKLDMGVGITYLKIFSQW